MKFIELSSVSQNNLKGFDLFLPFYHLIVVTGVSGSGKSSLVFDTLYAEGSRRYLETFSSYVRQYLERLPKPFLKDLKNIPPALAFPQGNFIKTTRSTVATLTEISHFTKMLYYHLSLPRCPICDIPIKISGPEEIGREILNTFKNNFVYLLVPVKSKENIFYLREGLLSAGFSRVLLQGKVCELEELEDLPQVEELDLVLHRIKVEERNLSELISSIEQALKIAGKLKIRTLYGEESTYLPVEICPKCGFKPPIKTPALFSYNTAQGACPECKGFGNLLIIDLEALVKFPEKSIKEGAIPFLDFPALYEVKVDLYNYLSSKNISLNLPFKAYPEEIKKAIIEGEGAWYGLKEVIDWLEAHRYKPHFRILLSKLRREVSCPTCKGTRFNPKALLFYIEDLNIGDFYHLEISSAKRFIEEILQKGLPLAGQRLAEEIKKRLSYLEGVGLSYLTLDRASKTLSGGEVSRCMLTRSLSSNLVETLYLLDEPTTGLHPRDTQRVLKFMQNLVAKNNTVVVVEHDPEIILQSDFLVELGPEGGEKGGHLLFAGEPHKIWQKKTPTSEALLTLKEGRNLREKKTSFSTFLEIKRAKRHNLKDISVKIPYGALTVITGVSGSGKSTLLEEIIYKGLTALKGERNFGYAEITNYSSRYQVLFLTQEPLARSPRSMLATYIGIYTYLRKLLASTEEAKKFGFTESSFSINSETSHCPNCKGLGYEIVEMQFLPDLQIPCEVCKGKRFREEILEIRWRGKNISEMLELTVSEAYNFFQKHREIKRVLEILMQLGLEYLKLGQPLSTLSGGEAQRLKIAELLTSLGTERAILLLDEPTVGLHYKDISKLLSTFQLLKDKGHTLIVVEHHPEVILSADWIIELGPEGGDKGGYLLYAGPLNNFLQNSCPTSDYLKEYLAGKTFSENPPITEKTEREKRSIQLRGIRHHNLQNIDLELPREKFIVITGLSGSGKSTLAFDVLFTEGQRRFLETLPAYLRQFFKLYEEIDFDDISGLPATVALEQRSGELSPRSTVGTLTEILPYLRLLYARLSKVYCPSCGEEIKLHSKEEILQLAGSFWDKSKAKNFEILAPLVQHRKGHFRPLLENLLKRGYPRVRIDGTFYHLPPIPQVSRYKEHILEVSFGKPLSKTSYLELIEKALEEGKGSAILIEKEGKEIYLSTRRTCLKCGISLPEPDPLLFAFNTKVGACPYCGGLGRWEDRLCPECKGTRYRKEVFYYKIQNLSLPELCDLSIEEALSFLKELKFEGKERVLAETLLPEIINRLNYLKELGLSYLTLSRSADTLSAGEAKRVRIAGEIGSNLTGVAYILDEPTIGLHPRDTEKLIGVLKKLRDKGNSVLVVEHDEEVIKESDYIVDLGPGGGKRGGRVIYAGEREHFLEAKESLTALALKDKERRKIDSSYREGKDFLVLKGVKYRNLKDLEVLFPLGTFICVVGVSGSGKSSLVCEVLHDNLKALLNKKREPLFGVKEIKGFEKIKEVYLVDPSPIGNTPRSVPATYIQVFTEIRKAFANTFKAREKGYREGRFSFNTEEGQCPYCKGQGKIKMEIKFLPSLYQTCEYCHGKRYNSETLEVLLKGKNIAEILELDFASARDFFKDYPLIHHKLDLVCKIGLDYITLGQPSPTLSGGEAQRIKLAKELGKSHSQPVLYLLDEPTTGLHILDIAKLKEVIQALVEKGHTVVVIEHNLELIKAADWIIELGPEGGERGGQILFQGSIKEFLKVNTPTSLALKSYLDKKKQ